MPASSLELSTSAAPVAAPSFRLWLGVAAVMLCLSLFVVRTYDRCYRPEYGWTRMITFGSAFERKTLPRLARIKHYVNPDPNARFGYDGQFYAQIAIDPSLRDPALRQALDGPNYRSQRILAPALAYCAGVGKPRWVIQAYALSNLFFWFVLAGASLILLFPFTWKKLLCLVAVLLGAGVLVSMKHSLVDLPAVALIAAGLACGSWRGYGLLAAATLARETSLLTALGKLDFNHPLAPATLKRNLGHLTIAAAPFAVWSMYVRSRFSDIPQQVSGAGNFAWPLQGIFVRFASSVSQCASEGIGKIARPLDWLFYNMHAHDTLTIVALASQAIYLLRRRDLASPLWRVGVCYLVLGCLLGPAVWENPSAAARVLLPMTLCFYLLLAREGTWRFAAFFVLGGISIPYSVHDFWMFN